MFKVKSGRKKDSPVWTYFEYEPSSDKSRCIVKVGESICGLLLVGKNTTNLRSHIQSKHKDVYNEIIAEEKKEKQSKETAEQRLMISNTATKTTQQTLTVASVASARRTWDPESDEHKKRRIALIKYVVSTGAPLRQLSDLTFKELCRTLDSKFQVPGMHDNYCPSCNEVQNRFVEGGV